MKTIRYLVFYASWPMMVAPLFSRDLWQLLGLESLSGYLLYWFLTIVVMWTAYPDKGPSKPNYSTNGRKRNYASMTSEDDYYERIKRSESTDIDRTLSFDYGDLSNGDNVNHSSFCD